METTPGRHFYLKGYNMSLCNICYADLPEPRHDNLAIDPKDISCPHCAEVHEALSIQAIVDSLKDYACTITATAGWDPSTSFSSDVFGHYCYIDSAGGTWV